jgi:uncharacterized protein (TIGR02596 family)
MYRRPLILSDSHARFQNHGNFLRIPPRAFSLIELLVIIGIIALLSVFAVPTLNSVLQGGQLSQATTQVIATLSHAMQRATSDNQAVDVRLIAGSGGGKYRYLQLLVRQPDGTFRPLDRLVKLPDTAQIATNPALTSFFNRPVQTAGTNDPTLPDLGAGYRFVEFQIRPNRRLSLDIEKKWFITVFAEREDPALSSPPANFATIQIDPVNGGITFFRP